MDILKTKVAIIGAGPSGLLLGQLLYKAGIDHIIVERQSEEYVASRIRAGILEQVTVDLLEQAGVDENLKNKGLPHSGIEILTSKQKHRIDLTNLTEGKQVTVYGQTEVTKDLMTARKNSGLQSFYMAQDVRINNFYDQPEVEFVVDGRAV